MITNYDQPIIPNYSPISAKGGKRRRSSTRKRGSRKFITRKLKTRRRYHS